MIRNYMVAGSFQLTTSQMGFNLYLGNNPQNPTPYYRPVPFAITSPFQQGIQFTIEASRRGAHEERETGYPFCCQPTIPWCMWEIDWNPSRSMAWTALRERFPVRQ